MLSKRYVATIGAVIATITTITLSAFPAYAATQQPAETAHAVQADAALAPQTSSECQQVEADIDYLAEEIAIDYAEAFITDGASLLNIPPLDEELSAFEALSSRLGC
jgi:hypothetical protein